MAFGNKYTFSYTNLRNEVIQAIISEDGFTGSSTDIDYTDASPIVLNWQLQNAEKESPLVGSTATFRLISEDSFKWQEFFYATDRKYKLTINVDSNLYWVGWLISGIYNEPYEANKYVIQLQFTDGLGDLSSIPLQDSSENPLSGQYELSDLLQEAIETNNPLGLDFYDTLNYGISITDADKASYQYRVTVTGTSGTANININGTNYLATFNTDIATTLSDFVTSHAPTILTTHEVDVEANTTYLTFGATTDVFTSAVTITNASGDLTGTVERRRGSLLGQLTTLAQGHSDNNGIDLWNCQLTLSAVLLLLNGCLFQSEGKWWIQSNNDVSEVVEVKNHGTTLTDSCESIYKNQIINNKRLGDIYNINNTGDIRVIEGYEKINFLYDSGYKSNVLSGGFRDSDFSDSSNLNDWIRTSASHIFFSNWNQNDLTIAKVTEAEEVSCRVSGLNSEDKIITVGFSDNGGNLEVTFTVAHGFSVNDVIYISYPSGEGEYEGFHTITSLPSTTELVCSGTSFTSNDWDTNDRPRCINFFNSRFLEQEINPQFKTSAPAIDNEAGQSIQVKIRYKIETTDSQDSTIDGAVIPVLIAVDDTTDQFVNKEGEWSTSSNEFYWVKTNVVNKWEDQTIDISLDDVSLGTTNTFYIALGQIVGRGYTNITGYLVSDISMSLTPSELATQSNEYTVNSNLKNKIQKNVTFSHTDGNLTFHTTFTKNGEYFSERYLFSGLEGLPFYINLEAIDDGSLQLNEIHEYFYKHLYAHNSLEVSFPYYENNKKIEFYHRIRDTMSMGKVYKLNNLTKNLDEGTGELTAIELRPREDLFNITDLSLTSTNHFIYMPSDLTGSPAAAEGIVNRINPYSTTVETVAYSNDPAGNELKFDSNNIPYFDSGNVYVVPNTEIVWSQPYTIFLAIRAMETVASDRSLFNSNDDPTTTAHIYVNNDVIYVDAGTAVSTTGSIDETRIQILVCEFNGASTDFYIDNTLAATVSAGTDQLKGISLMGDNPTSGQDALSHRFYGILAYNGALTTDNREGVVNLFRQRTQADRVSISSIRTDGTTAIDITFDRSVTGFNSTGLELRFKSGTARTISSISGSGTDWTLNLSGAVSSGDIIELIIDDINPATTTDGSYIYPGIYPVTNNVVSFVEWDLSSYSSLVEDYSPYAVSTTGSDIDNFTGTTTNAVSAGVDKLQVSTDSFGYKYCQITRGDDQGYTASFGTIAQAYSVFYILELDSTDSTSVGYLMDSIAAGGRASVWRNLGLTKLFAGTTYNSAMTAQEDQVITIGYVADGSSSSVYLNGSSTDSEINIGTNSMGTGMTLFDRYTLASLSATFKFYRVAVFDTDIGSVGMADLHTKAKNMYNGAITV